MPPVTPSHLIAWFLEFAVMVPDRERWHVLKLRGNPPRLLRLQRLCALTRAFGLGPDIRTLETGEFILERDLMRYAGLVERIQAETRAALRNEPPAAAPTLSDLQRLYQRLLDFRNRLQAVLEYNSGVLEASGIHSFSFRHIEGIIQEVAKARPGADELLSKLISPEGEIFDEAFLIQHYGFPKENIRDIDLDWI